MVVTCENCSARYKLDDSRISGRGAKITCPRCRHVFVVYKERPAAVGESKVAVGGGVVSSGAAASPPATPRALPLPVAAAASDHVDVDKLDFRKVGIQAWKVKVKIGLIYDFSDYRTLARYIAEGRVTSSDKLSHDGRNWTEISQLGNLAGYFVKVYQDLEAEAVAAAAAAVDEAEDYDDDEPTNIMGMGTDFEPPKGKPVSLTSFSSSAAPRILPAGGREAPKSGPLGGDIGAAMDAALDAESPKRNVPTGPTFIDPFKKRKAAGRRTKPPSSGGGPSRERPRARPGRNKDADGSGGLSLGWVAAIALAILGGGYWWWSGQPQTVPTESSPRVTTDLKSGQGERDRRDIRRDIEEDLLGTPTEESPDQDVEESFAVEDDEPKLIPVRPKDAGTGASSPGNPNAATAGVGGRGSAEDMADGESAFQRRDYRTAASAFGRAVDRDPRNARYNGRFGAALARAGDADGAMAPLTTAANGGYSPALVYLGDLAQRRGDTAGAVGYYQSYLITDPPDARAIQVKIEQLTGL